MPASNQSGSSVDLKASAVDEEHRKLFDVLNRERVTRGKVLAFALTIAAVAPSGIST